MAGDKEEDEEEGKSKDKPPSKREQLFEMIVCEMSFNTNQNLV